MSIFVYVLFSTGNDVNMLSLSVFLHLQVLAAWVKPSMQARVVLIVCT